MNGLCWPERSVQAHPSRRCLALSRGAHQTPAHLPEALRSFDFIWLCDWRCQRGEPSELIEQIVSNYPSAASKINPCCLMGIGTHREPAQAIAAE